MSRKKIQTRKDIEFLVDRFYDSVRKDEVIGPVFNKVIGSHWDQHLEKMYRFWQTILLKEHTYYGSPFPPHARLSISKVHFERWLTLFEETIEKHFGGEKAAEALWRASKMAQMFQMKIEHMQKDDTHPLM